MQSKFASPIKSNNKGSCSRVVNYLEKENSLNAESKQEYFFSDTRDQCNKWEVVQQIDNNAKGQGLEHKDDRFYSIIISPSQTELAHIGNDPQQLKAYTREVMENYAANFNKNITSKDLVWYAKIENERKYTHGSSEVKASLVEKGSLKEGDQRHIHIIVSRCAGRENRHVLQEGQLLTNSDRTMKLSPLTNQRGTGAGAVKSGFDRSNFFRANEQSFDRQFGYSRPLEQSYDHCNSLKNGTKEAYQASLTAFRATNGKEMDHSLQKSSGLNLAH